jgi:DNA-directed RNA polymerase sigma subunit (sigma70/sigma32)
MTETLIPTEENELLELLHQSGADALDLLSSDLPITGNRTMETIDAMLQSLSEEEFEVVDKYFGLSGEGPYSAEEIGAVMGLDESEVGNIIARAMRSLRDAG